MALTGRLVSTPGRVGWRFIDTLEHLGDLVETNQMVLRASNPHEVFTGPVPAGEPVTPRMAQQGRIPLTVNQLGAVAN